MQNTLLQTTANPWGGEGVLDLESVIASTHPVSFTMRNNLAGF